MDYIGDVVAAVHTQLCIDGDSSNGCRRWAFDARHKAHYEAMGQKLFADLEPVIGAANVAPVVRRVLEDV